MYSPVFKCFFLIFLSLNSAALLSQAFPGIHHNSDMSSSFQQKKQATPEAYESGPRAQLLKKLRSGGAALRSAAAKSRVHILVKRKDEREEAELAGDKKKKAAAKSEPDSPKIKKKEKLVKDYALPERVERLSGVYFWQQTMKLHQIMLLTLPIDSLLLYANLKIMKNPAAQSTVEMITFVLLGITLLAFNKGLLFSAIYTLQKIQRKFSMAKNNRLAWIVLGIIAAVTVVDVLFRISASSSSYISVIMAGLFLSGAGYNFYREVRAKLQQDKNFENDPILWLEHTNQQIFTVAVVPLVSARLIATMGALLAPFAPNPSLAFLLYLGASLSFLLFLTPKKEDFIANCQRCAQFTSRALAIAGYCPACDRQRFQKKEAEQDHAAEAEDDEERDQGPGAAKAASKSAKSTAKS